MAEEKQKIHATMIFEIIGKPPEYLMKSLEKIISQIGEEEGVEVKGKSIKDPKKLDNQAGLAGESEGQFKVEKSDFYITFADVEVETDNIMILAGLMFKYMPAHIEVISPENISLPNGSWGDLLTEIIQKLHAYDEVARVMQVERAALENKIRELLESQIKQESKSEKKTAEKPKRAKKK